MFTKKQKSLIKLTLQAIIVAAVCIGLALSVRRAGDQLIAQRLQLRVHAETLRQQALETIETAERAEKIAAAERLEQQFYSFWHAQPSWLLLASVSYIVGLIPAGLFWRECLRALGQPAPMLTTMWAYFLGHLGKYVPGKAMALVLRVGALHHLGIMKLATTLTVFMETLTMMAVGGAAAAISMLALKHDWQWTILAGGLLVSTVVPTFPPCMRLALRKLQRGVDSVTLDDWLSKITWILLLRGWWLLSITWICNGFSLYCILKGLPTADFANSTFATLWLSALGACALAVVLGFVSMLPAGAGVRELVLSKVLAPVVGPTAALASAVWLRLSWLCAELVVAAVLWGIRQSTSRKKLM